MSKAVQRGVSKTPGDVQTPVQKSNALSNELQMLREEVSRLKRELAEARTKGEMIPWPVVKAGLSTTTAQVVRAKANPEGKGLAYRAPCGANCRVFHEHVLG